MKIAKMNIETIERDIDEAIETDIDFCRESREEAENPEFPGLEDFDVDAEEADQG